MESFHCVLEPGDGATVKHDEFSLPMPILYLYPHSVLCHLELILLFAPTLNNVFAEQRIALGTFGRAQSSHDLGTPRTPAEPSPFLFSFPLKSLMTHLTISASPNNASSSALVSQSVIDTSMSSRLFRTITENQDLVVMQTGQIDPELVWGKKSVIQACADTATNG